MVFLRFMDSHNSSGNMSVRTSHRHRYEKYSSGIPGRIPQKLNTDHIPARTNRSISLRRIAPGRVNCLNHIRSPRFRFGLIAENRLQYPSFLLSELPSLHFHSFIRTIQPSRLSIRANFSSQNEKQLSEFLTDFPHSKIFA